MLIAERLRLFFPKAESSLYCLRHLPSDDLDDALVIFRKRHPMSRIHGQDTDELTAYAEGSAQATSQWWAKHSRYFTKVKYRVRIQNRLTIRSYPTAQALSCRYANAREMRSILARRVGSDQFIRIRVVNKKDTGGSRYKSA
jgi:hypothetical protein